MNLLTRFSCLAATFLAMAVTASAQIGNPYIHDPSTIVECDGKYYTFGTGEGGLISEDGYVWKMGGVRPGGGAVWEIIYLNDADKLNYVYILFEDGQWWKRILNL